MQYLFEASDGQRYQCPKDMWNIAKHHKQYHVLVSEPSLLVFTYGSPTGATRTYKFGGRNRGGYGMPWNGA